MDTNKNNGEIKGNKKDPFSKEDRQTHKNIYVYLEDKERRRKGENMVGIGVYTYTTFRSQKSERGGSITTGAHLRHGLYYVSVVESKLDPRASQ